MSNDQPNNEITTEELIFSLKRLEEIYREIPFHEQLHPVRNYDLQILVSLLVQIIEKMQKKTPSINGDPVV